MNYFIKIIGSVFLLAAMLVLIKEYESFLKKRLEICRGFAELLSHIRRKIDGYLTPAMQLTEEFECEVLTRVGYIEKARDGGISSAYFELEKSLSLDSAVQACLSAFFSDFGKDYKEGTVKSLDMSIATLRECMKKISAENERSLKLARTLGIAAVLGLIILLI